jgi:hypothetical protein
MADSCLSGGDARAAGDDASLPPPTGVHAAATAEGFHSYADGFIAFYFSADAAAAVVVDADDDDKEVETRTYVLSHTHPISK